MNKYSGAGFDWYRNKIVSEQPAVKRGNLSVLATAEFRGGQMVSTPLNKPRYVWPNPYSQNRANILSRRALGR